MFKKILAILTTLCLLLSFGSGLVLPVSAEVNAPFARDMALYPEDTIFLVEDQQDLTALARAVNNGRSTVGYTFLQTADITLSGSFTPIGINGNNSDALESLDTIFKGTYDGQYHTISNLNINLTTQNGVGLFGACYQATIKNVGVESGTVIGYNRVGGIAGYADACLVVNCYNRASVQSLGGTDGTAGIAGVARQGAVLKGCFNEGDVSGSVVSMGGIAGWGQNNVTILGCYNGGSITNSKTGASYTDAICRNDAGGGRDFSTCYYLADTCSYNAWGATALSEPDYAMLAYKLNEAGGTQAFTVGEWGLCFSDGETVEIYRVNHQIDRDGVLLEGESGYYGKGEYTVPESQLGLEVEYALCNGRYYLPEESVDSDAVSLDVTLYVKGEYPSVTEIKEYPDEEYFTVSSAEELAALAPLTKDGYNFAGKTVFITEDLDFSDYTTWTPIGHVNSQSGGTADAASYPFCGNINGQGHRFLNIDLEMNGDFQAFFGYVQDADIENIILEEGEIHSNGYRLGALVSLFKNGEARDIESHLSLYSTSTKKNLNMGLFALTHGVTVERVVVYGTIGDPALNTEQQNGGISGCGYDSNTTLQYSFVPAKIHGTQVFQIGQRCVIKDCPLVGSEGMPYADFLGGKAAWFMNTANGARVNCGKWGTGAGGPTLMGDRATYKLEVVALTNEGDELEIYDLYYNEGEKVTFPDRPGYTFTGAYLGETALSEGWRMPAADQTVYLHYDSNFYYINYYTDGGEFSEDEPLEYQTGDRVVLPDANSIRKEGYGFGGWYESEDFSGDPISEIPATYSHDISLYAKWLEPTVITTAEQLCALYKGDPEGYYRLGANIDLTDRDFTPIGTVAAPFMGTFDGAGYTISGLVLEDGGNYRGLFGYNKGYICNVTLAEDCTVSGNNYVGGIAGANEGIITDCISHATVSGQKTASKQYSLMSQNLCVWGNQYDIESVATRQPWMKKRIEEQSPDFLGFQECSPTWVEYLTANLSDTYTFMYKYREPSVSSSSESSMVGFKTAAFDLLDSGYFWLSETPDICSKGWDAGHWRICHWMFLQDKVTGQKIGVFNTHLDLTDQSKLGGANVVHSRMMAAMEANPDMVILACGDFNSEETTAPYTVLTSDGILDARYAAPVTTDEYTHTKGAGWGDGTRSIDYIFGHEDRVIFDEFDVLNELSETGSRLSDHNGVLARFRGKNGVGIGGAVGYNMGRAERLILNGAVSGIDAVGGAIGKEEGYSNRLYLASGSELPSVGKGDLPTESDNGTLYDYDTLSFIYRLNQAANRPAFTLRNEKIAVLGKWGEGYPVLMSINGLGQYALSGEEFVLDTEGYATPICTLDGEYFEGTSFTVPGQDCAVTVQESKNCTDHTFGEWYPLDSDQHIRYCTGNPSHTETGDHDWQVVEEQEADCNEPAAARSVCKDCGDTRTVQSGTALGHDFGDWISRDATSHYRICDRDDAHIENLPHRFTAAVPMEATCEKGAGTRETCLDCGYVKETFSSLPLGHLYGDAVECDSEGHERICQRDENHRMKESHQSTAAPIEISCTNGAGVQYHCRVCLDDYAVYEGEGLGHQYGGWQPQDDYQHIRYCAENPDHFETGAHDYDDGTYHAATCTEGEYTAYTCSDCGHIFKEWGTAAAFGHSLGEWYEVTPVSETQRGLLRRDCQNCTYKEERVIPTDQDPAIVAVLKEIDEEGNVTIDLELRHNPGIAGLGVKVYYDAQDLAPLEENPLIRGGALSAMMFSPYVDRVKHSINIVAVDTKLSTDSGVLYTMRFKLNSDADVKTLLRIEVSKANTVDDQYRPVTIYDRDLEFDTGVIHCHDYRWNEQEGAYICQGTKCQKRWVATGDISGDGILTTQDALLLLRHLMGREVELNRPAADFNQNGVVAIHDVIMILRVLNGKL